MISKKAYLAFICLLLLLLLLRIISFKETVLPIGRELVFEAKLVSEPRIYDENQVLYIANLKVYEDLYPRYKIGDRVRVSGFVDLKGRMFRANVEKIGQGQGFLVCFLH